MKKKIFITIIILLCIFFIFTTFILFNKSNDISNTNLENIKNLDELSNDKLIEFSNSGTKFPDNFIDNKLNDYERIINSSNSIEEAKNAVLEEFNTNNIVGFTNTVVKNNLLLETNSYYGLDVSWIYTRSNDKSSTTYSEKVISFKKSIYDSENNILYSKDKTIIKEVLNLVYYMKNYNSAGNKVLQSAISEGSNCFEYTIYYIVRVYGDWGLNDVLHFQKDVIEIDKETGKINLTDSIEIKEIEISGTDSGGKIIFK